MKKVIYFTDGEGIKPFMFVKAYRKKSLFKRENVQLSYFEHELGIDDEMANRIIALVKKHYPNAIVGYDTVENFKETMYKYEYYVVTKFIENGGFYGFYTGVTSQGEHQCTTEIEDAQLHYDATSAEDSARLIAKETGDRVAMSTVHILNVNPLSEQEFVIVCQSKKSGNNQFYSRMDGKRVRLVRTSDAAAKFSYSLVLPMFEQLKADNKAFNYSVIPYIQGVNCADLERLNEEGKIPHALMMTTKLKWMERG